MLLLVVTVRVEFDQLLAVFFDGIDLIVYWNRIQSAEYIKTLAAVIMKPTIFDDHLRFFFRGFGLKEAQDDVGEYADHDPTVCYIKRGVATMWQHPRNGEA
jgi:hypothetical protein